MRLVSDLKTPKSVMMPIVPHKSEIQVKVLDEVFKETDEKRSEILAKISVDFRPSISREIGHKKFHTNSSAHQDLKFHTAEPKFFHSDTLGVGGPKIGGRDRMAIGHQKTTRSAEILAFEVSVIGCDR